MTTIRPAGFLVIAGVSFPVTGIELRDGRVWIFARRPGPVDCPGGPVTIFGADGKGIGQGSDVGRQTAKTGEVLEVRVDIIFETVS